jgi:hypothetical protein
MQSTQPATYSFLDRTRWFPPLFTALGAAVLVRRRR